MINVTKTFLPDKEKYKKYVDEIFKCGWLTNDGKFVQQLKKELEEYLGVKHIILLSNGTIALQVAYRALELEGEVITTPFSFVATTSTLAWERLSPKFIDIDKETFNIDYTKIEEAITKNTSAIVPVHVFGNPCEVEKIDEIAKKSNLKVIYDAAHAFGVNYKGKSILNYGDISTMSFHSTKVFHTIEGGAIIVNNDELYNKIKLMINFGINKLKNIEYLGTNAKMNEFQAAMGLCVLDDMKRIFQERKRVYEYYINNLPKSIQFQKHKEDVIHNYSYFPVAFESEKVLLKVEEYLNRSNIYPRRYFYPSLETLPYLKDIQTVPISSNLSKRILCLPMYDTLDEVELNKIVNIIKEAI
ncbi:DegT/DnrJ/EryC1/StrS family aminotransferase [Clostridium sporogenes]|uniref:DegT/DnrJ/EryC1/StrS family aminotransferase n=1 Tax=Clostridium sporogenes TaxID=1509 RepID=UPI0013D331F8|nr:DegT/DnrJ/EryC1/StrS family aminotransferase [Clostridium sporogenes]MDU1323244.1 DegT/DnrJ/EryC1/StrS family aminotransferase [Clostridium botulinum]MDU1420282.1 DegT/DnrJ/EryC1/StrS family aminotransferase [Clostridium botulinum]NFP91612.1 DegT/DnrJ/EryC1/StrS family aminotransferase [Clostridium sporogenes]